MNSTTSSTSGKKDRSTTYLFKEALQLLEEIKGTLIVEIGVIRDARPIAKKSDGWSTLYWAESGYPTFSVDTEEKALRTAQKVVKERAKNGKGKIAYLQKDGKEFLAAHQHPISLLYLDGPRPDEYGKRFCVDCFRTAKMASQSILLIDDCDLPNYGKGEYVIPAAIEAGFTLVKPIDRQALLVRR